MLMNTAARDYIIMKWQNRWNLSERGRFYNNFHQDVKLKNLHDVPREKLSSAISDQLLMPNYMIIVANYTL